MLYLIGVLFFVVMVIVVRYRFREEWDISSEQTKKEVIIGFILFGIIVILAQAYSDEEQIRILKEQRIEKEKDPENRISNPGSF